MKRHTSHELSQIVAAAEVIAPTLRNERISIETLRKEVYASTYMPKERHVPIDHWKNRLTEIGRAIHTVMGKYHSIFNTQVQSVAAVAGISSLPTPIVGHFSLQAHSPMNTKALTTLNSSTASATEDLTEASSIASNSGKRKTPVYLSLTQSAELYAEWERLGKASPTRNTFDTLFDAQAILPEELRRPRNAMSGVAKSIKDVQAEILANSAKVMATAPDKISTDKVVDADLLTTLIRMIQSVEDQVKVLGSQLSSLESRLVSTSVVKEEKEYPKIFQAEKATWRTTIVCLVADKVKSKRLAKLLHDSVCTDADAFWEADQNPLGVAFEAYQVYTSDADLINAVIKHREHPQALLIDDVYLEEFTQKYPLLAVAQSLSEYIPTF